LDVTDREQMKRYTERVPGVIKQYGGRYLSRGAPAKAIEGDFPLKGITILEFPSVEVAQKFWDSPEYAECKSLRANCSNGRVALIEGSPGEAPVPHYLKDA
jgi:uncharacterized protein (DUF1330 family)